MKKWQANFLENILKKKKKKKEKRVKQKNRWQIFCKNKSIQLNSMHDTQDHIWSGRENIYGSAAQRRYGITDSENDTTKLIL